MSTILTAMVANAFIKNAYTTYSYTASMSRYYHPDKAKLPPIEKEQSGNRAFYVTQPTLQPLGPKWGKNKPASVDDQSLPGLRPRLNTFSPTISGTGSGKRYWDEPRDPYM